MLKGCQRQIIKISGCADTVFEEAYFILKPTAHSGMSQNELIKEANRIINENSCANDKTSKRYIKVSSGIFYTLLLLGFSGFAFSVISLLIL